MSDLTFNKVAGAVLATGLAIVGLRELSTGMFSSEKPEKAGYAIAVVEEDAGGGAAAEVPPDWGTVLPTADVAAGEAVFAKCKSCHSIEEGGPNGTGPDLWGVIGHKPGTHAGFAYSAAMTDFGAKQGVWDHEHIYEFVKAPQKYISGTKMTFVGLKKQEDRINLIAFLQTKGASLPIPAPNPAAAAAPAADAAAAAPADGATAPGEGAPASAAATPGAPAAATAPAPAPAPAH